MRIAIIGPSGAGKSTFARELGEKVMPDYRVFEADRFLHELYCSFDMGLRELLDEYIDNLEYRFGLFLRDEMYNIDRKALGDFLFSNDDERKKFEVFLIEKYIRPEILEEENIIVDGVLPAYIKEIPFDNVIYVTAPRHIRVERLLKRGVDPARIVQIMNVQEDIFSQYEKGFFS
jgi:dephospho-CoA kinase